LVPIVSGADAELVLANGDQPTAGADADMGFRPICGDGDDFPFCAAVWAELVVEQAYRALAEDGVFWKGLDGCGF